MGLPWFDVNCVIGPRSQPRPENDLSPEETRGALARLGIGEALVRHSYAMEYDPVVGNRMCAEYCRENEWATPCYVLLPAQTGEMAAGEGLLKYLAEGGARAATLKPTAYGFAWGDSWVGETLHALERGGVPLVVESAEASLSDVEGVLTRHPRLHLIYLRPAYGMARGIYGLLAKFPRFHLEFSYFPVHHGIREIASRFGPERLVFGTGLPEYDPGVPVGMLMYAEVSEEARAVIAGDGLRKLLWKARA